MSGIHDYVSTACHHDEHDRCRLVCKFCETDCGCGCHRAAPREVAARAIWEAGAWAGDCCDHTDYDACTDCQRVCRGYADAALQPTMARGGARIDGDGRTDHSGTRGRGDGQ